MREFWGTFLLVFFGCGSFCSAVMTGAQVGVFQVAIVWGLGIGIAIYLCGSLSGAHLNPAVTLSMAVRTRFRWGLVLPYFLAQFAGAFTADAMLYPIFGDAIKSYEAANGIVRGQPGSEASAMVFGKFFPNPGGHPLTTEIRHRMSAPSAFGAEVAGTAILLLVSFCVTDRRNESRPRTLAAATIGLTVTLLISLLGPLTMACFNAARDLAPRVFSAMAGWGPLPFVVNGNGWFTVYILAPLIGGVAGGALYRCFFKPAFAAGAPVQHSVANQMYYVFDQPEAVNPGPEHPCRSHRRWQDDNFADVRYAAITLSTGSGTPGLSRQAEQEPSPHTPSSQTLHSGQKKAP